MSILFDEQNGEVRMSSGERNRSEILVVETDPLVRSQIRQILVSLEFGTISDVGDHAIALQRLQERTFSHVIFECKKTKIPMREFLSQLFAIDEGIVAIPSCHDPTIDEVFDLLCQGARSLVVKPFTAETLDYAIVSATKGEPLSEAILNAKDRNEALAALMLSALDRYSVILRQARQFATARRDIPKVRFAFKRASEVTQLFCKGGHDAFLEALVDFAVERSEGPATRLGRVRRRLQENKSTTGTRIQNGAHPEK